MREYVNKRKVAPDEVEITIVDFKPDTPQPQVEPLRLGLLARDSCGDGSNEFKHIDPLVTWQRFPVLYFIESSVPATLHGAIEKSFAPFNEVAGFEMFKRTTNLSSAKIRILIGPIDVAGGTIARTSWSYSPSRKEITKATITFDKSESWGELQKESCGRTGGIYDIINVGVHENGHHCGLGHAPTDKLQTMYASTSPGVTLGRTLGNGDKQGFKAAYSKVIQPPQPNPQPEPQPEPQPTPAPTSHDFTDAEVIQIKILRLAYDNAKKAGDQAAITRTREELQQYIIDRLAEKHTKP